MKHLLLIALILFMCMCSCTSLKIEPVKKECPSWVEYPPACFDHICYFVGVSEWRPSVKTARGQAMEKARKAAVQSYNLNVMPDRNKVFYLKNKSADIKSFTLKKEEIIKQRKTGEIILYRLDNCLQKKEEEGGRYFQYSVLCAALDMRGLEQKKCKDRDKTIRINKKYKKIKVVREKKLVIAPKRNGEINIEITRPKGLSWNTSKESADYIEQNKKRYYIKAKDRIEIHVTNLDNSESLCEEAKFFGIKASMYVPGKKAAHKTIRQSTRQGTGKNSPVKSGPVVPEPLIFKPIVSETLIIKSADLIFDSEDNKGRYKLHRKFKPRDTKIFKYKVALEKDYKVLFTAESSEQTLSDNESALSIKCFEAKGVEIFPRFGAYKVSKISEGMPETINNFIFHVTNNLNKEIEYNLVFEVGYK